MVLEEGEAATALVGGLGPEGPTTEASSATDSNEDDLVYDHDRFRNFKAHSQFKY